MHDAKRELALCMTVPNVANTQLIVDALLHEMQGIETEIALHTEEINGLAATPTKSNCSPNN